jgi:hypothetical protein
MAKQKRQTQNISLDQKLVLFNYFLGQFALDGIKRLGETMRDESLQTVSGEGQSGFYYRFIEINANALMPMPREKIQEYDFNIVRHMGEINKKRPPGGKIKLKYFQYFTLLFIEHYLDRYAEDAEELCGDLNSHLRWFTGRARQNGYVLEIPEFAVDELNKIAVWNATGSGKTILMHINILQARHYLDKNHAENFMLLTPNEGLSEQHLREFRQSGIDALRFNKNNSLYTKQLAVIEVTKLTEQSGPETVAVDSFGSGNILFVDEGHTGSRGDKWMPYRRRLCSGGFSFEYSATFGQAAAGRANSDLQNEYAKCIIFDYSYKYFYEDGYGKDYNILNLPSAEDEEAIFNYLGACLLVFFQQKALFADMSSACPGFRDFHLESPLLVFVGSTVNAVRTENREKVSDVVSIVLFLRRFIENKNNQSVKTIEKVLSGKTGLLYGDRDVFAGAFPYLQKKYGYSITQTEAFEIFDAMINAIFGNAAAGARIHVDSLPVEGEISLTLGEAPQPFGLINVGDSGELLKLLDRQKDLVTGKRQFGASLFADIQRPESSINILIGSKKFTAGWNCYRVSSMGLMYVGQSEGSEIIQLFGRGIRLWGYGKTLQRTNVLKNRNTGLKAPDFIQYLETLNIFGVKANYMEQFKEYLSNEGLPPSKTISLSRTIPVLKNKQFKKSRLQKLALPPGVNYIQDGPVFFWNRENEKTSGVTLDCYTSLEVESSLEDAEKSPVEKNKSGILLEYKELFDYDSLYAKLVEYKNQKNYLNAVICREYIKDLLSRGDWYTLFLPPAFGAGASFGDINKIGEFALRLLKRHLDVQYAIARGAWEGRYLRYEALEEDDENFIGEYEVILGEKENDASFVGFFENLVKRLNTELENGTFKIEHGRISYYNLPINLYNPLLKMAKDLEIIIRPLPLNDSESRFVQKLDACGEDTPALAGCELYLIRNKAQTGIGFFETRGFYPDFILWIIEAQKGIQHIVFIEPHGLGRERYGSEKMRLYTGIKEHEKKLENTVPGLTIRLHSYILSPTPFSSLGEGRFTKEDYNASGVYFMDDPDYLERMCGDILG